MIDDEKYGVNPNPNDCVHTGYKGLCPACKVGAHPVLTQDEKTELKKLPEWDRIYFSSALIKEKCLRWVK